MNKQKIISLSLISAFIFGSAFSTLFSLKKDIIVRDEIYTAQEIQNRLDEYQEKYEKILNLLKLKLLFHHHLIQ